MKFFKVYDYQKYLQLLFLNDLDLRLLPNTVPIFVSEWLGIHISLCLKLLVAAKVAATAGTIQELAIAAPTV